MQTRLNYIVMREAIGYTLPIEHDTQTNAKHDDEKNSENTLDSKQNKCYNGDTTNARHKMTHLVICRENHTIKTVKTIFNSGCDVYREIKGAEKLKNNEYTFSVLFVGTYEVCKEFEKNYR